MSKNFDGLSNRWLLIGAIFYDRIPLILVYQLFAAAAWDKLLSDDTFAEEKNPFKG